MMIRKLLNVSFATFCAHSVSVFGQEITGFTLIDADSDSEIRFLSDGDTINLSADGMSLSVRADITGSVGSVRFGLDGNSNVQTENVPPYALNGDSSEDYEPEPSLANIGSHTITATLYSGSNAGGSAVASYTITVTTVTVPTAPTAPTTLAPVPTPAPVVPGDYDVAPYNHSPTGALTGELLKWHKITLGFDGPTTSETATPNPFTNYRLDVTFTHADSGSFYVVPGYYAADGNAANSGASSGSVWAVHFSPDATGTWTWVSSFVQGSNVAQNGGGSHVTNSIDGLTGSFNVAGTDKSGRDFRGKGRLQYVGEHHLRFAEAGEWFLKAGADSPENFLAYEDFDNTPNIGNRLKSWAPHADDYQAGDPTWAGGKGKSIIGAINYLALVKGMNVFSFLPMNINGDDENVFPYISSNGGEDRKRIGKLVGFLFWSDVCFGPTFVCVISITPTSTHSLVLLW